MDKDSHILLFDGICGLCNGLVQFIIKHDKKTIFKFIMLQSEQARTLLNENHLPYNLNTVVYISGNKCYRASSAILHVFRDLGKGWQLLFPFIIVPEFIRDFLYKWIADRRYSIMNNE